MLLRPVSFLDISVFLLLLSFYLVRDSNIILTFRCGLCALPFLGEFEHPFGVQDAKLICQTVIELPFRLLKERCLTPKRSQMRYTQRTTVFQDVAIRCIRWAFTNVPSDGM